MSTQTKIRICGLVGIIGLVMTIGILGDIDQGGPVGNIVFAFASLIVSFFAFYKGGYMTW